MPTTGRYFWATQLWNGSSPAGVQCSFISPPAITDGTRFTGVRGKLQPFNRRGSPSFLLRRHPRDATPYVSSLIQFAGVRWEAVNRFFFVFQMEIEAAPDSRGITSKA